MELNHRLNAIWQLFQQGKVIEATELAKQIVNSHPNSVDAQQLLGICYAKQGNDVAAEATFQFALGLAPNQPQLLANQATLRRRQNRLDEAVQLWRQAVAAAPKFAQAWIDLGLAELKVGRANQAVTCLQQATTLQPQSTLAWHGLGNALRANGDLPASANAFKRALALNSDSGTAWLNLGSVERLQGHIDEALQAYAHARKSGIKGPELEDAVLGSLLDNGQADIALQTARNLVNTYPEYVPGHESLANILWEYGAKLAPDEDPLQTYREAVLRQPSNKELQLAFCSFLLKAKQATSALEYAQSLYDFKNKPQFQLIQAEAHEMLGQYQQASRLFAELYRIPEMRNPRFLNTYTRHLLRVGQFDVAEKNAKGAIQLDPFNQEAWAYLSTSWRMLGDAREYWLCDYERLITLQEIEVPKDYIDLPEFLQLLRETLDPMHLASHAPVQQSLREGSQTPGRLFGRKNYVLDQARQAMQQAIELWLAKLPADSKHPFLCRKTQSVRFSGSWSVKLWSSGKHVNHIHPEGWLSSAFYVALPASVITASGDNTSGCIQFGQPLAELNLDLPARRIIKPELGKLALFPSYMWHGTVPFVDDEPRISIAFDMQPN